MEPGRRLGPYEIVAPIGAGGMGEVFRARDTRLDRSVAVKILTTTGFAQNEQLKARFDREARTISQLSHPHICTLFDIGHEDGIDFLVMELLEGESLSDRLARGPIPLSEVVRYGCQIAQALDRAHRSAVIHRDLKPGNIMLTKSGAKLLDFGLAKSAAVVDFEGGTVQKPLTQEGTILGTFQYMAPEQLEGSELDARSDIFAFGCVLYEMVTGKRAFDGKTRTSLIAAIVSGEPRALHELQPLAPNSLEHLIAKCLSKDPDDRWQSAHDIGEELRWIGETGSQAGGAAIPSSRKKGREAAAWSLAAIATIAAALLAFHIFQARSRFGEPIQASILPPRGSEFSFVDGPMAISPDGRRIVFLAQTATGENALWIRTLRGGSSQTLAGSEGASYPFWSPDSRFVGFFGDGKLKKIDVTGGPPQTICAALNARGGSWNRSNIILFALVRDGIYQVPAAGGDPGKITTFDAAKGEADHRWPFFLPDGKHYLFLARAEDAEESVVWLGLLGSKERKRIIRSSGNAACANGYLLFSRERTLLAQPFNSRSFEVEGDPVAVAEKLTYIAGTAGAVYSVSDGGLLAFAQGSARTQLTWFDRSGKESGKVGSPAELVGLTISPDGGRVAADILESAGKSDIWIHELARSTASRFTFKPIDDFSGVWSPDGEQIAFATGPKRPAYDIAVKPSRGSGVEETLWEEQESQRVPVDWSRDGRFLLVGYHNPKKKIIYDIWLLSMADRKRTPLVQSPFSEFPGGFSPDGSWFVYSSNESGKSEIYAQPIGRPGKLQLSPSGGTFPRWSGKGDEIFYLSIDRKLMSVPVKIGKTLEAGDARILFEARVATLQGFPYSASPDGQRFLAAVSNDDSAAAPTTIIANWPTLIGGPR